MPPSDDTTNRVPTPAKSAESLALPSFANLFWLTLLVAALVIADASLWALGKNELRSWFGWNLSFLAAIVGGARFIYHAVSDLLDGKFGTDLALAFAVVAALLLGENWVAAEVVLIALIGESLEAITFRRTQVELSRLLALQPATVQLQQNGQAVDVPLGRVQPGDIAVVRPGERIPIDGEIVLGHTSVDQSTLTGESVPVDKEIGGEVFAGTLNQFGLVHVRVDRVGTKSLLGQVLQIVSDSRKNKAQVERLADRMTRYFLPAVLVLAAATFVVDNLSQIRIWVGWDTGTVGNWQWMPTLAVLVVSCPCALVLATPAAMLAALAWLARRGVLVRGGAVIERLAAVTHIAFDKTGTLTRGQLHVAEWVALEGADAERVIRLAAAAEQGSEHLIGQAILQYAREHQIELGRLIEAESLPGAGVKACVSALVADAIPSEVLVGNRRLHVERSIPISQVAEQALHRLETAGLTPLLVSENGAVIGVMGVGDTVRPEAAQTIEELRSLGIANFAVLSGDRPSTVRAVAAGLGIDRFAAELRPTEKANWLADWSDNSVANLQTSEKSKKSKNQICVAMVGDGVNDAPALATCDVGIALRSIGSEIAAEAADVILLGDPLRPLPNIVRLARETVRVIYQNVILFAFAVNFLGVILTAWILPNWSEVWRQRSPAAAALFHQLGSLLVLLNAMRLIWFERWQASWFSKLESGLSQIAMIPWEQTAAVRSAFGRVWQLRHALGRFAVFAALLAYLTQVVIFVQPDEVAVVKRFGRVQSILPPGPHLRLPPPFDLVLREQPLRARTIEIGWNRISGTTTANTIEWNSPHAMGSSPNLQAEPLWMTGDRSLVELAVTIQYRLSDVKAFRFATREPERLLGAIAESIVREIVASQPLLAPASASPSSVELLSIGRIALESKIAERLQQRTAAIGLGVEILPRGVCVQDVHPPQQVVDAFRDVSTAFKERERMKNEGESYRRDKLIQAGGETIWRELSPESAALSSEQWTKLRPDLAGEAFVEITAAESFAQERRAAATGDAAAFVKEQLAQSAAPQLAQWRLFMDTISVALADKPKILLDRTSDGRRHLFLGFPRDKTPAMALPQAPNNPDE